MTAQTKEWGADCWNQKCTQYLQLGSVLNTKGVPFVIGGDYDTDPEWILFNQKRYVKKFQMVYGLEESQSGVVVWKGTLNNIKQLEKRYQQMVQKYWDYVNTKTANAFEQMKNVKSAHAKVSSDTWCLYKFDNDGVSSDYLDEEPKKKKNLKIGQHFHDTEKRTLQIAQRANKFYRALQSSFQQLIDQQTESHHMRYSKFDNKYKIGHQLRISLNDHQYWFHLVDGITPQWKILSWPQSNQITNITIS